MAYKNPAFKTSSSRKAGGRTLTSRSPNAARLTVHSRSMGSMRPGRYPGASSLAVRCNEPGYLAFSRFDVGRWLTIPPIEQHTLKLTIRKRNDSIWCFRLHHSGLFGLWHGHIPPPDAGADSLTVCP